MASIEERKGKNGTAYRVLFRDAEGTRRRVCFDSDYPRSEVEKARRAVEGYLRSKKFEEPLDRETRLYFANATPDVLKRFENVGFDVVKKRKTIQDAWLEFVEVKRAEGVKSGTLGNYAKAYSRFAPTLKDRTSFFDLTGSFIGEFRTALSGVYAKTTVATALVSLGSFASCAMEQGYAEENPFQNVEKRLVPNKERDFQVPGEWTERILDACRTQTERTLFALWRLAALRYREPSLLKRSSFDFKRKRFKAFATKTERHATGGFREVPICSALEREVKARLAEIPDDEDELFFDANKSFSFDGAFRTVVKRAGLEKWPKFFQNLRSSRENDWIAMGIPAHVVAAWTGRSVKTQEAFYLRVLPEYFDRAVM